MNSNKNSQALKGVIWASVERFSVMGVNFVVSIILARLLSPSDFGLIGMISIFIVISDTFVNSSFSSALIQKIDRTERDYSTVFYFNIAVALLLYLALFFAAPYIARFYDAPILENLTKISGLILIINAFSIVQLTKLKIRLDFRTQAKAAIIASLGSGTISLIMAYAGMGIWALACQPILCSLINALLLCLATRWIPALAFSWGSFKSLFSYGSKLLLAELIDVGYISVIKGGIGKAYSPQALGFYSRAEQFSQLATWQPAQILNKVTFPVLSSMQNDEQLFLSTFKKYFALIAYIIFPLAIFLIATAHPIIILLLGEKWAGTVPILQILLLSGMWRPINGIYGNVLYAKGHSAAIAKLAVIKSIAGIAILYFTLPMSVNAICFGFLGVTIITQIIYLYYIHKILSLNILSQFRILMPILLQATAMGVCVWLTTSYIDSNILKLAAGLIVGVGSYWLMSLFITRNEYRSVVSLLKTLKQKIG